MFCSRCSLEILCFLPRILPKAIRYHVVLASPLALTTYKTGSCVCIIDMQNAKKKYGDDKKARELTFF